MLDALSVTTSSALLWVSRRLSPLSLLHKVSASSSLTSLCAVVSLPAINHSACAKTWMPLLPCIRCSCTFLQKVLQLVPLSPCSRPGESTLSRRMRVGTALFVFVRKNVRAVHLNARHSHRALGVAGALCVGSVASPPLGGMRKEIATFRRDNRVSMHPMEGGGEWM